MAKLPFGHVQGALVDCSGWRNLVRMTVNTGLVGKRKGTRVVYPITLRRR